MAKDIPHIDHGTITVTQGDKFTWVIANLPAESWTNFPEYDNANLFLTDADSNFHGCPPSETYDQLYEFHLKKNGEQQITCLVDVGSGANKTQQRHTITLLVEPPNPTPVDAAALAPKLS